MTESVVDYLALALALGRLEDLGLSQGPLADRVRDAMDAPWRAITREEQGWIDEVFLRQNQERGRRGEGVKAEGSVVCEHCGGREAEYHLSAPETGGKFEKWCGPCVDQRHVGETILATYPPIKGAVHLDE